MIKNWLADELSDIKDRGLYRRLTTIHGPQGPRIKKDGRELINLSSNNYLGLTTHPAVKKAAVESVNEYGTGAGASRLTCGNTDLYDGLEEKIADFKGTEAAIVFGTGYMANLGVISSLMKKGDLILSDELNHASIIDGCRLSRADVKVYPHSDTKCLERMLASSSSSKKLIVTDGIFSMDGDIAPLGEIVRIADEHDAMVMVDDAHATGVLGKHRRGTADHFNIEVDINMGTLSKSLAGMGGYVAGTFELIDYLRNSTRSFIYSTALPPPAVAAAKTAIEIVEKEDPARKLWKNVIEFRNGLTGMGIQVKSETQIIPLITGSAQRTLDAASELEKKGVFAPGIRPPTVPEGRGRIRTSLMATHTGKDIKYILDAIQAMQEKFRLT